MWSELASKISPESVVVSITEGLAGNIVTAGIIAPIIGIILLRWRHNRWKKFRSYLAHLVDSNHDDLLEALKKTQVYLDKLSDYEPEQVRDIDDVEFSQHRNVLSDALQRMEDVGTKFHFAMEPDMLEAWAKYHAEAWSLLRDPNAITWNNAEGIISSVKRGYEGFNANPAMFDDVFSTPMSFAANRLSEIKVEELSARKTEFIQALRL